VTGYSLHVVKQQQYNNNTTATQVNSA